MFCVQGCIFKGLANKTILIKVCRFLLRFCIDWWVICGVYVVPSHLSTTCHCPLILYFLVILPPKKARTNFTQTDLLQFYSMLARSTATSTPKGTARRPMAVKLLDPLDLDNNAFVLVNELVLCLCCVFLRKKTPNFPLFFLQKRRDRVCAM